MDQFLEKRWKAAAQPFDGDCLHLKDFVQLSELRHFLVDIVNVLRKYAGRAVLYQLDDWHEHDGFVTQRSEASWDEIDKTLADDESLFANRPGDTYVNRAFYPDGYSFLLRYYVLDADEEVQYPGKWGACDLSAIQPILATIKCAASDSISRRVNVSNSKVYFDSRYGG